MPPGDPAPWQFGDRPESEVLPEFKTEFRDLVAAASRDSLQTPDGQPSVEQAMFQAELLKLMKRAHSGTVREVEYDVVNHVDVVVELKHPRPGNLQGWHYRLYTGVPVRQHEKLLVWLSADRKQDVAIDPLWKLWQNEQIRRAVSRFKAWLNSRLHA
ncbi:hypothetical protein ACFXG4_08435 [Nocardia sp. NPDC059246]|uniref:hypothetical protein n=1 Tax=unclassified Nocardia TaxID=2637762 RepID=UPI00367D63DD